MSEIVHKKAGQWGVMGKIKVSNQWIYYRRIIQKELKLRSRSREVENKRQENSGGTCSRKSRQDLFQLKVSERFVQTIF